MSLPQPAPGRVFCWVKHPGMHDQLASWVGNVIAGTMLVLGILRLRRRHREKRSMRFRHFKGFGVERTRLDIDDQR